jgi:hypothetical protein
MFRPVGVPWLLCFALDFSLVCFWILTGITHLRFAEHACRAGTKKAHDGPGLFHEQE